MNKGRFKGGVSQEDAQLSLNVLIYAFMNCIISMAPYVPFTVEYFY
jgi:isoleucyl-tRNA synthetase